MKKFVYVLKDDIKTDLILIFNRIDYLISVNNSKGFQSVESLSIFPALFRLFAHLWMKKPSDLFKKKYIGDDSHSINL